ncbi:MAG: DUF4296 domain-containing protein [Bacteroidales bacterium]|nr:DUF4296 domain-containing protein [Bacteroidales bacterium]
MRIVFFIWATVLLLGFSCTRPLESRTPEPSGLIQKDSMISLLVDIHLAEAILYHKEKNGEKTKEYRHTLYKSVFEKHGTDAAAFEASFNYYQSDVDVIDDIYQQVLNALARLQGEGEIKEGN